MKAKLRLVGVELPRALFGREPYVTAIALSGNAGRAVPVSTAPAYPGEVAAREEAAARAAAAAKADAPQEGTPIVTEPASGIKRGDPLELDLVLFDGDPGDWLIVRGAVMESDGGARRAGQRLDEARHALDGSDLGRALVRGVSKAAGVTGALVEEAAGLVAQLLRANGDDLLAEFEVRVSGVEDFRKRAGEIKVEGRACVVTLQLDVEGLPEAAPPDAPAAQVDRAVAEPAPGAEGSTGRAPLDEVVAQLRPAPESEPAIAVDSGEPVPETAAVSTPEPETARRPRRAEKE